MYFRVKRTGSYQYVQIVRSFRDGKQVRQQVIATLGRLDLLRGNGELEKLIRSGSRLCEELTLIDAHEAGDTEPVRVLRIGPDLVFSRLWQHLRLGEILSELLEGRRYEFDVERAVYLTVLHRLFAPGSDRAAERWRGDYRIPGTETLQLHHLYRAMAFLGQPLDPNGPCVLGAPRCTKDVMEERLFEGRRDLFSEIDLVFFDTTSIYFEGNGGCELGKYGNSKDSRPDLKQMIVGMALDAQGWPLCCHMWAGNTADVKTLLPVVEQMRQRFGVRKVSIVADRGMISQPTLQALEAGKLHCDYILGARMRRMKEVRDKVLSHRGAYQEVYPERKNSKDPSPLKVKEVFLEDRRYIVCLNEEQRRKDAADREAIVEHLREQLKQGDKSLIGNKGYRKFLKAQGKERFLIDEKKIRQEARYDGKWVLRTNMDLETEVVALAYKQLWMVEEVFRTMKSTLETRPIYHKADETIRGHVFCSFLAVLLRRELERRLEERGHTWEWAEILRGLDNLHEVEATFRGKKFLLRSQLKGQAHLALQAAGASIPATLRQVQ